MALNLQRYISTLRLSSRYNPVLIKPSFRLIQFRSITQSHKMPADQHQDQCLGDSTDGKSSWKQRAPYRIHDRDEDFKTRYSASCHCGKVQYQISREEPLNVKFCHCRTCQKQHGLFHLHFSPTVSRHVWSLMVRV